MIPLKENKISLRNVHPKRRYFVFEWTWVEENMLTRHHFHFQCMHMDTRSEKCCFSMYAHGHQIRKSKFYTNL